MGMKGHPQNNGTGGGSSGGGGWMMKNKMAMVAVVILMGVIGVMVVQKVKDRRLFNLVIKDKDRQIFSLNLLLQKERQYAKENKRKNQDLNAKLYSLRTQKIELTNKMMEMRSIIGSMKDEHRALELAIDEKQNEINQKETEIKDLKNSRKMPPKIWSVGSNDTLNYRLNVTERSVSSGQLSNGKKPNHQENKNPDVKVQKPKDEASEALQKEHNGDAKIDKSNVNGTLATKEKWDSEENGDGLTMKGRRFFIGATESQRDKSNGQDERGEVKANTEEGPTEVARFKSGRPNYEADRMDEDEAETKVDMNSARNGSAEDQDYKEAKEE
ncbi:hypothetical protein HanRHA438_Chr17g0802041 [Helianthus annuus]|uniref:Micronuclear linker histone polyprotein-like protein n=1 Tax=Helianthus annuus TaxID=4232 RepID=A0A9K3DFC1_HELAN|nr:uncharacterized protein LOC110921303 [Helianthus annuus]KAF5754477.1 hypothetical protein HanXRQr2_Chr17g0791711 [Helianthus annuus]KAJ0428379.1 hypothetical protein HanHA300_Chr17g0645481 [Helianthus annuus]KAJ0432442.1 hypothetical protein HanIR_Chr17g0859301 [Helianthus annuus]KAJ0446699.1 hypothetical protein HanHA89_Chr17g0697171 [Helianthus annuus]KAJ0635511.1 hypothetical protein HanOQP8_Chr17g0651741 [Helianthus annuus]